MGCGGSVARPPADIRLAPGANAQTSTTATPESAHRPPISEPVYVLAQPPAQAPPPASSLRQPAPAAPPHARPPAIEPEKQPAHTGPEQPAAVPRAPATRHVGGAPERALAPSAPTAGRHASAPERVDAPTAPSGYRVAGAPERATAPSVPTAVAEPTDPPPAEGEAPLTDLSSLPPFLGGGPARMDAAAVQQMSAAIDGEFEAIMAAAEEREAQLVKARAAFAKHDADGSGALSPAELPALLRALGVELSAEQYAQYSAKMMRDLDRDRSGALEQREFCDFYLKCLASERARRKYAARVLSSISKAELRARARQAFAQHDTDKSGAIDRAELSAMLRGLLEELAQELGAERWEAFVADVIRRGDTDQSARFEFKEFAAYYEKCLSSEVVMHRYEQKVLLRLEGGELVIDG